MAARVRGALVAAAILLGVSGLACMGPETPEPGGPDLDEPPQGSHPLVCNDFDLRLPAFDSSMMPAWASFQIAQLNQEALAPLEPEERRALFETCILPAIQGAK